MKYSYEDLAKMIDHSLLHPTMTDQDLEDGCKLAAKYQVASVCIKPYAVKRAAELLKPGGTLVYSTCSLETEENDTLVETALAAIPNLRFVESRRSLPFVDGMDGAFAAKFIRLN